MSRDPVDPFVEAAHREADLEEVQARASAASPEVMGLPTQWRRGASGEPYQRGPDARVHLATADEVNSFGDPRTPTCGSCVNFDLSNGRKLAIQQKFAQRLVNEEGWQLKHALTAPADSMAVCREGDGDLLVPVHAKACDHYRPAPGRKGRWRPGS